MSMKDQGADRQDAILDAAFRAFATYGFRRTTMDDVARGAGLSRTALYLHYRNKEDIFRSLALRYFAQAEADLRAALRVQGQAPDKTLHAAFIAKDGKFMDVVLGTPHGRELLEAGYSLTADIAEAGELAMEAVFVDWLRGFDLSPGVGDPADLGQTLLAALKGLKHSARSLDDYRAGQARLAKVFALALTPRDDCVEAMKNP